MKDEKRLLTADEAIGLLPARDRIHTFANPGGMLLGADHDREGLIEDLRREGAVIEIAGGTARGMNHGLVLWRGNDPLFIETHKAALDQFDPL